MTLQYTSIERIFSKLMRDVKDQFDEGDVIEWCGEALEFIKAPKQYENSVAFIEVINHQCQLPNGIHNIIQIARNMRWGGPKGTDLCPATILNSCSINNRPDPSKEYPSPSIPVAIDCNGEPVDAYDVAFYRPYFDLRYEYELWAGSDYYRSHYKPVTLATNTFFNSLVCKTNDYEDRPYQHGDDEYTIVQGKTLRFSFREGSIALAYNSQLLDPETGYPMIPDDISYTTAIVKYVTMKMMEVQFYNNREGAEKKMLKAESDWQWYCKQAGNQGLMLNGIDEHQNFLNQRSYILPRNSQYYGFFGKLGKPEHRTWNDPDYRNRGYRFFRGN